MGVRVVLLVLLVLTLLLACVFALFSRTFLLGMRTAAAEARSRQQYSGSNTVAGVSC